jgi:hypothetical protein
MRERMVWILACVIGALVGAAFLFASLAPDDPTTRVEAGGGAGPARVEYGVENELSTIAVTLDPVWSRSLGELPVGTTVILRVTNLSPSGHVTCRLFGPGDQYDGGSSSELHGTARCSLTVR